MSEITGNLPGEDNLIVPDDYKLKANEISFSNGQIILPENTIDLQVSFRKSGQKNATLNLSIPIEFLKSEGQILEKGEIGVRTDEDIASTIRADRSRLSIAWDPVDRTFIDIRIPVSAFKKDNGN